MLETVLALEDMKIIDRQMLGIGFRSLSYKDFHKNFTRLKLRAPRMIRGCEEGYIYHNNDYTIYCWTTFVKTLNTFRAKGEDLGWVLITDGDEAVYFARPFKRTSKSFVKRFLSYAWVTKWKVDNRPLCDQCQAWMHVFRRPKTRQYMWVCKKSNSHLNNKWQFKNWDQELPPKAQVFVNLRRKDTQRYNKKNKKAGLHPTPSAQLRSPWIMGNRSNKFSRQN